MAECVTENTSGKREEEDPFHCCQGWTEQRLGTDKCSFEFGYRILRSFASYAFSCYSMKNEWLKWWFLKHTAQNRMQRERGLMVCIK